MERGVTTATWGSPLPCKQALRGQTPNLAFPEDVSIKQRKTSQLQENLPTFNKLNKGKEINKV